MAELTNLTDRITHLRDRKASAPVTPPPPGESPRKQKKATPERRLATDYFMLFAYGLLAVALIAQGLLLVWLDVI